MLCVHVLEVAHHRRANTDWISRRPFFYICGHSRGLSGRGWFFPAALAIASGPARNQRVGAEDVSVLVCVRSGLV